MTHSIPGARKYIHQLKVGIAQTFGGGLAIGGEGKFDPEVKAVARKHGMTLNANTGEWHCSDNSKYAEVLAALERLAS